MKGSLGQKLDFLCTEVQNVFKKTSTVHIGADGNIAIMSNTY